jgi:hypothetical protein
VSCPVPVPSGIAYRVASPPQHGVVTPRLARALRRVLERFAQEARFTARCPVTITFQPGVVGHHRVHRAADIYAVGGVSIDRWKRRWDRAHTRARRLSHLEDRRAVMRRERRSNLGWRLYRALTRYGRWSQPYGYPIQLFGPWTRSHGPWRFISDRLLHAHRDHIHVAK